ncbi:MAG TPA: YdcH family protein [Pseudomonadales bacterium]
MSIQTFDHQQQRQRLMELRIQHRQLDQDIIELESRSYIDSLELRRLKKRKLQLKDAIVRLESRLIPDLNA